MIKTDAKEKAIEVLRTKGGPLDVNCLTEAIDTAIKEAKRDFIIDLEEHMVESELADDGTVLFIIKKDAFEELRRKHLS